MTTERTVAPYGSWRSPIAVEEVVEQAILLSEPWLDGDDLYWIESHPAEGGRGSSSAASRWARRRS